MNLDPETGGVSPELAAGPETIGVLIEELKGKDGMKRKKARLTLVGIGGPAVSPLIGLLSHKSKQMRWEAAKALSQLGNLEAVPALIALMEDDYSGIRWLAAEGLVAVGPKAVQPVLKALIDHTQSSLVLAGAHHVLHDFAEQDGRLRDVLQSVLEALEGVDPESEVPPAAGDALDILALGKRV